MMMGSGAAFGGLWMMLVMVLAWILLIVGAVWLLATLFPTVSGGKKDDQSGDGPLAILQKRYAQGEISKEEFETIRHHLEE
jgi:putative membrane protein